ncbi:hypothetical protein EV1_033818 [Malus domestica]
MCPYSSRIPPDVTIVGEGYELACRRCIREDNMCEHNMSYARAICCVNCNDYGHSFLDCPMPNMIAELNTDSRLDVDEVTYHMPISHKSYNSSIV